MDDESHPLAFIAKHPSPLGVFCYLLLLTNILAMRIVVEHHWTRCTKLQQMMSSGHQRRRKSHDSGSPDCPHGARDPRHRGGTGDVFRVAVRVARRMHVHGCGRRGVRAAHLANPSAVEVARTSFPQKVGSARTDQKSSRT